MVVEISTLFASTMLIAVYNLSLLKRSDGVLYRLLAMIYFAVWSAILWITPHEPTRGLLVVCLVLIGILPVLAYIPRRAPKNRRQTKALLERIQQERKLETVFRKQAEIIYWPVLWCLIWSLCYRLVSIYQPGAV